MEDDQYVRVEAVKKLTAILSLIVPGIVPNHKLIKDFVDDVISASVIAARRMS